MTRAFTLLLITALAGCGAMNTARPLDRGEHAAGLTLGGPLLKLGGKPVPMPNAVVEARHGVAALADRPLELGYGLNLTGLAYGVVGLQGHVSWLAMEQRGAIPALSVTNRLYFASNHLDARKADPGVWGLDQLDVTASWLLGDAQQQLVYLSLTQNTDLIDPALFLSPGLGAQLDPGEPGGLRVQVESRWYAPGALPESLALRWVSPGRGALGFNFGVNLPIGPRAEETSP